MKGIKSQLGSFNFGSASDFGELTIPNAKEVVEPERIQISKEQFLEQRSEIARQQKEQEKEAPIEARNKFELLTGIGRLSKEVEIEGFIFSLRSLKRKEIIELNKVLEKSSDKHFNSIVSLAFSLYKIQQVVNGELVEIPIKEKSEELVNLILELEDSVYLVLIAKYNEILDEYYSGVDKLGKDPKEVYENIKKS